MIVIGGTRGGGLIAEPTAIAYDPACDRWRQFPEPPRAAFRHATAVWTGDEVIVWGGQHDTNIPDPRGAALDPETGRWRNIADAPVRGFYNHSAVWTGDEMVVWGWVHGTTGQENEAAAYDPATDTWRELPPAPLRPPPSCECNGGQSAVWTGDRMLAWSGTLDRDGPLMLSLDPATGEWQRLDRLDGPQLYHPPMVWTGAEALVSARYGFAPPRP
jgi:hypothetical protein